MLSLSCARKCCVMRMASRRKKNNFTGSEIEVLLSEIQIGSIFSSVSCGITEPPKAKKWEAITSAVNSVSGIIWHAFSGL